MAFTYPGDQQKIWAALNLGDRQLLAQDTTRSCLYELMRQIDEDDISFGSTIADTIKDKIDELTALRTSLATAETLSSVRRKKEEYVVEVEYKNDRSSATSFGVQIRAKKQEILTLLDPCGCCIVPYVGALAIS